MGIYVHIPFCRSKCFYCGFYSVASAQLLEAYVKALCLEMKLRKDYLPQRQIDTLYFGGGTPSYLAVDKLNLILDNIHKYWDLADRSEVTLEMNPEDAEEKKLKTIQKMGFNRLSIGVQSFHDKVLKQINRHHTGMQALQAVEMAAEAGFTNLSVDLIIGLPGSQVADLEQDLYKISQLPVTHVSVYMLSVDNNSVFEKLSVQGKLKVWEDDVLASYYLMAAEYLKSIGFEHYEISNFAKNSQYSVHNTSYWQQKEYLGLGTAAHSYNRESRQWNIAHLKSYIESLNQGLLCFEKEILSEKDKYNEYLMTNFRTMWGINVRLLQDAFPSYSGKLEKRLEKYLLTGHIIRKENSVCMSERGWLISDRIFSDLFES